MRVLVFGASITQGFWDTEGGWVQRLRRYYDEIKLKNIRKEDDYPDIFNLGISGNTTKDVLKRFKNETEARTSYKSNPAFIFSIGTNNAIVEGGSKPWSSPEEYIKDLENLAGQASQFSTKIMFVGLPPCDEKRTTPVFWRDIHYTNERILLFDKVAREFCANHKIPHVATFEPLQEQFKKGNEVFADGLHPNNKGHELIFRLVRPALDKLLAG